MAQICQKAADEFRDYTFKQGGLNKHNRQDLLEYAYALIAKYGEAEGAAACQFYEEIAEVQGAMVQAAEMAELPEFSEVAKAVNGAFKTSDEVAAGAVQRLTKQVGADTILKNAKRDGAWFAWVAYGDSCPYCLMMSAIGWQRAGEKTLKGRHAEHIHANCDCQYAIDFKGDLKIEGYDPLKLEEMIMESVDPDGEIYGIFDNFLSENARNANGNSRIGLNELRRRMEKRKKIKENRNEDPRIEELLSKLRVPTRTGNIIFETGTDESDRETCKWIHSVFGGNITCLAERPETGKMPDAIWNGTYWEFKAPTSKNAIDDRVRKASKQLMEALKRESQDDALRGILIDITNNSMTTEEAVAEIEKRATQRKKGPTEVIVKKGDKLITVIHIK